jgi:hypothetical protein
MKKTFITTITCAATVAFAAPAAKAASYTVFSGDPVNLVNAFSDVNFSIPQFDPALGTLTGVIVRVLQSNLTGSFIVTNSGASESFVPKVTSDFRVRQLTAGLGYTAGMQEFDPVLTTPSSNPSVTINPSQSVTFNINAGQTYTLIDQNISSSFFTAYQGPGSVNFEIRNRLIISTEGATYAVDAGATSTTTQMGITYTYEAIPETSSALLGGIGILLLLRRRRIG